MNIGFDAKRFFNNFTGLGNYSRFIVSALAKNYPQHQLLLFSPRTKSHPELNELINLANVKVISPNGLFRMFPGSVWRSGLMSLEQQAKRLDVFHGLSHEIPFGLPANVTKVVTVHDLIFIRYPSFYSRLDAIIYKAKIISACDRADRVVAISEQTADDLVHYLKVPRQKIDVVYQGCHPIFRQTYSIQERQAVSRKYNLPERFVLNVGTIEKRKNIAVAVDALGKTPREKRIPLVIVGKPTDYLEFVQSRVKKWNLENEVHFVHNLRFSDLPLIYQSAEVFIYPSLFEGFGIPLIEAIVSGVPVLTSNGSCFAETAGPDAIFCDPASSDDVQEKLSNLISDSAIRERVVRRTQEHIKRFEPETISKRLMEVYTSR